MIEMKHFIVDGNKFVAKRLFISDYSHNEIGVTGFDVGDIVVIHSKDERENALATITAVQSYSEDPDAYESFLTGNEEIQTFLNCPDADGSAEFITDYGTYLICWEIFAEITKKVVFEESKCWC